MKIKRYLDKDMRHVLRQVREDQGPDAVILSNRRVSDGIEVIAAIDYDEALVKTALTGNADSDLSSGDIERLVQDRVDESVSGSERSVSAEVLRANLKPTPSDVAAASGIDIDLVLQAAESGSSDTASEANVSDVANHGADAATFIDRLKAATEAAGNPPLDVTAADDADAPRTPIDDEEAPAVGDGSGEALKRMQDELASLRGLLETQLSGLVWKDATRRFPQRVQMLRNLARLGIAPDIANMVIDRLPPVEKDDVDKAPLVSLAQLLPTAEDRLIEDGGVAALIGPTGVGKTTTIAKIAARFALEHGADEIALVSADSFRIGAREHLKAFANIIGVPVHSASSSDELEELLAGLRHKKLVLIDTEGRSQRDRDLADRLAAYGSHSERVHFYLTLSAATQEAGLDEAIRTFNKVPLSGCIVTKVDEAGQLGCVISTAIRHDLPIAWISDGQRIPDDLHPAARKRLWLVNQALECIESSQPRIDERMMAENYSQASVAHG